MDLCTVLEIESEDCTCVQSERQWCVGLVSQWRIESGEWICVHRNRVGGLILSDEWMCIRERGC